MLREAKSSSVYERSEYISGSLDWSRKEVVCRKKSARDEAPGMSGDWDLLLFIIRVKRELQRVYRNGCRYNERLNAETGGSKTPHTHWVARPIGLAAGNCRPGQTLKKPKYLSACDRDERGRGEGAVCMCEQVA